MPERRRKKEEAKEEQQVGGRGWRYKRQNDGGEACSKEVKKGMWGKKGGKGSWQEGGFGKEERRKGGGR